MRLLISQGRREQYLNDVEMICGLTGKEAFSLNIACIDSTLMNDYLLCARGHFTIYMLIHHIFVDTPLQMIKVGTL